MNDNDKKIIHNAISIVDNVRGQLTNIGKRGPGAAKTWKEEFARMTDAANKAKLKDGVLVPLLKLLKDLKTVIKDLDALYKEGAEPKKLAAYADAKAFRAKAMTKYLASAKTFEATAQHMILQLKNILGAPFYPGMSDVDVKALVGYVDAYVHYYNELRIALAKA